jgi:hypothetical protein
MLTFSEVQIKPGKPNDETLSEKPDDDEDSMIPVPEAVPVEDNPPPGYEDWC